MKRKFLKETINLLWYLFCKNEGDRYIKEKIEVFNKGK